MRTSIDVVTRAAISIAFIACPTWLTHADQARSAVTRAVVTARLDESEGEVVATLKNGAAVPLEAWRLTFVYATRASASSAFSTTSDTFMALAVPIRPPDTGPLEPGASRELRIPIPAIRALKSTTVDGALFGDVSFEGDPAVRAEILRAREAQAAGLAKWIGVLDEAAGKDAEQARQTIRRALEAAAPSDGEDPARGSAERLLASPDPAAASRNLKPVLERLRDLALRHRGR